MFDGYNLIMKATTQTLSKLRRERKLFVNKEGTLVQLQASVALPVLREFIDKRILYRTQ